MNQRLRDSELDIYIYIYIETTNFVVIDFIVSNVLMEEIVLLFIELCRRLWLLLFIEEYKDTLKRIYIYIHSKNIIKFLNVLHGEMY